MSWPLKSLDELGFVGRGKSKHRPRDAAHLYNGAYPFIQTGDVKHAHFYITEHKQTYSEAGLAQSKLWKKDTLCITIAANIADTAILSYDACFPDSVIGIIPDKNKADVRYLKYLLDTLKKGYKNISHGAAQDNLSQQKLLSLKFPTPPLNVQTKIADVLSAYDYLIENNRRRIQLLEESARLLYREWFVHLRFPGHEHVKITDGVPEGWYEKKVGDMIGKVKRKKKVKKEEYLDFGKIPCVDQSRDFIGGYTDDNEAVIDESLPIIVFGDHTRVLKFIDFPFASGADGTQLLIPIDNDKLTAVFLYFALDAIDLSNYFYARHFKFLKEECFLLPTINLVKQFTEFVQPNMNQIKKLMAQNKKLKEARDLLLPRLMNGEITV